MSRSGIVSQFDRRLVGVAAAKAMLAIWIVLLAACSGGGEPASADNPFNLIAPGSCGSGRSRVIRRLR
jgi:hypothetical protein